MTDLNDLEGYIAECERKIEALDKRLTRAETQLATMISVAARDATAAVIKRLRVALEDE